MPAKSLGTLPVFYAVDELQNPLFPVQQCCLKVIGIAQEGEVVVSFQIAKDFRLSIQHCMKGEGGSQVSFLL